MAKILCAYSGIEFTCEHFPVTLHAREAYHPIFNVPQKKLLSFMGKWAANELTPTDSYLLFLALLNSTDKIEFRVPVSVNPFIPAIVANNMELLSRAIIHMNTVANPSVVFPNFAITPETKFLSNVRHWIECWENEYNSFKSGYVSYHDSQRMLRREQALERLIKNPHKPVSSYANQIAEWAEQAAHFPTFIIESPFTKQSIPINIYWKDLIVKATRDESLYSIPEEDLHELLEHCEEKMEVYGSIYTNTLFTVLRNAIKRQKNFLGLGNYDASSTFTILDDPTDTESANMAALIAAAPTEEPRPEQYPSKFEYMKAKMRWDMSQRYGSSDSNKTGK